MPLVFVSAAVGKVGARQCAAGTMRGCGARSLAARLAVGRDEAFLARTLVRLHDDVPIGDLELRTAARWRGPRADADAFFAGLGSAGALKGLRTLAAPA